MSHEEFVLLQRARLVECARKLLAREIDVLEAALAIHALGSQIEVEENDKDLQAFMVVRSEIDSLPVGPQRELWAEEALLRKEPDMVRARAWAYDCVREEAESLIRRFGAG